MGEYLDLRVHDMVALDEIALYAEVLSAVAASDRPLTLAELDDALGVQPGYPERILETTAHQNAGLHDEAAFY